MATTGATCGAETSDGGACQLPAGEDGTCHLHDAPTTYTAVEYRQMDRATAEAELTEAQLEQWRQWNDLYDDAEATKAELQQEAADAVDTLIRADLGELTDTLDLYGNDVGVYVDFSDEIQDLREQVEATQAAVEDPTDPSAEDRQAMIDVLGDFFGVVFYAFNGEPVHDLPEDERQALGRACVEKWGLRASAYAFVDVLETTNEADADLEARVEKFRQQTGRGRR